VIAVRTTTFHPPRRTPQTPSTHASSFERTAVRTAALRRPRGYRRPLESLGADGEDVSAVILHLVSLPSVLDVLHALGDSERDEADCSVESCGAVDGDAGWEGGGLGVHEAKRPVDDGWVSTSGFERDQASLGVEGREGCERHGKISVRV
jgi:hypothetical protein